MIAGSKIAVPQRTGPLACEGTPIMLLRGALPAALFVVTALALSACATTAMSESECLAADWVTVGFADGVAGRSLAGIDAYRQACAGHGVSPDLGAYRAGHADGVTTYCRPQTGFQVGRNGTAYQGVCPVELEPGFLESYNAGRRLNELERAVGDTNRRIASLNAEEVRIREERERLQALILSSETTEQDRGRHMARVERIDERIGQIPVERAQLEAQSPGIELELREYRETLASQGLL